MLVGEVFARMGLDDKQYKKSLDRLEGVTQKKAMTLGSIFRGAFSFAIGIGVMQGFRSLGGAVTDFINTAARTEVLDVAMKSVARASGYATQALQEHRKAVMDMGIAEQEASQILTRFMQAQLDTADAAKLARVAQDAAVIAGYNSSQAAEQMTEAIAKQRPELLSAFGMTRNMNEIYNDYAKTVGKINTQLSEAEKKQAMLNYILKEGEKIAGTYEASMGAVGKQIGSLPRYWDTLKNAIAKPFALPAISVIVDGITNSLKNAISWAEVNQLTLQRWGQTAANVAGYIIRAFRYVGQIFAQNWALIRFVGIALLTYATATKIAAGATAIFQAVSLALNGQLTAQIPILSWVSTAMGIYKVQMALAAAQGIALTGVIAKLRVALYSLWSALGPIGWAILLISGLTAGGMALWNKYTQSLQKATQAASPADLAKGFRDLEKSTQKSANATEDQADALNKAGKAAGKNLQSFDEVHQLQEDMAGSAEDMALDVPELEDIGIPELPDMDLEGMVAGIEPVKGTLSGFWEWIKEQAGNVWDSVKQKWSSFINWVKSWDVWGWLGQKWSGLKNITQVYWAGMIDVISTAWKGIGNVTQTAWQEVWKLLQTYWNNTAKLATDVFGAIWDYIKGTWNNIKSTTSNIWGAIWGFLKNQWETIKTFAINIFGTVRDLILGKIDLRTAVKQIWGEIKSFFFNSWTNIRDFGINIWDTLLNFFLNQWLLIQGFAIDIWTAIKDFFVGNWEATKEAASSTWTAIKDFLSSTWEAIKTTATGVWSAIMEFLSINVEETREKVLGAWTRTKDGLLELWDGIIKGAKEKWDGVKTVIKGAINGIIGFINKFIRGWNKIELKVPSINIPLFGTVGGWTVSLPEIKEIPMLAKGGLVTAPTLAMIGERGPEAVVPLENTGFVDAIASAVGTAVLSAIQFNADNKQQGDIVIQIDGTTLARVLNPYSTKETKRIGPAMITAI
jgi:phage-related protein